MLTKSKPSSAKSNTNLKANMSDDLLAKEEEYLRLNAEIEEKTKKLVREVSGLSNEELDGADEDMSLQLQSRLSQLGLNFEQGASPNHSSSPHHSSPHHSSTHHSSTHHSSSPLHPSTHHSSSNPTPRQQSTYITDIINRVDDADYEIEQAPQMHQTLYTEEPMPEEARHLGPEAAQRFLKAKVRVLQEEVEHLTTQTLSQKQELIKLRDSCRNAAEEKTKFQRNLETLHSQLEKYTHMVDNAKSKNKTLETELVNLRKDIEMRDRSEKKSSQSQKTVEVRLNRALEDVEKYKGLLAAARSQVSESNSQDKQTMSTIQADNKMLQKQKTELIGAYKKQLKLIDVLRRQKLHLEASRMLNFTQEEFMKVLDWKNSS